jgi:lysozyme
MSRGIDVSPTFQPVINWPAVKAAGYGFAYLKVTEGSGWPAPSQTEFGWYPAQCPAAAAAGVLTGPYHFAHPSASLADADTQAAFFVARVGQNVGRLLPMLDLETNPDGLSPAPLIAWARRWLFAVDQALSCRAGVYTYPDFLTVDLAGWNLDGRALWLADPSGKLFGLARVITQTGQQLVPGIAGLVDVNETADAPTPAPAPIHAPAPAPAPVDWTPTVRNLDLRNAGAVVVKGPGVRPLQSVLRTVFAPGLAVDGNAGPITLATLRGYQQSRGLGVDGIAGPATYNRLIAEA